SPWGNFANGGRIMKREKYKIPLIIISSLCLIFSGLFALTTFSNAQFDLPNGNFEISDVSAKIVTRNLETTQPVDDDDQLYEITATFKNLGAGDLLLSYPIFSLETDSDFGYLHEFNFDDVFEVERLTEKRVPPNESITCSYFFAIPKNAKVLTLKYNPHYTSTYKEDLTESISVKLN
ncbi:MAG: hypothetical protein RR902_02490, partial [Oscillospiraceae bacterium]